VQYLFCGIFLSLLYLGNFTIVFVDLCKTLLLFFYTVKKAVKIAVVGSYNYRNPLHDAINQAIDLSAVFLDTPINYYWFESTELDDLTEKNEMDGWWIQPSVKDEPGAYWSFIERRIIQKTPVLLTGLGFELIARYLASKELLANDQTLRSPLQECPLNMVSVVPTSLSFIDLFRGEIQYELTESAYVFPSALQTQLANKHIDIEATNNNGNIELFSLKDHPFFVACRHLPHASCSFDRSHPLIDTFINACKIYYNTN